MQWVSGVARLFVDIQGEMVQVDLLPKGAEGFSISGDLRSAVELLTVSSTVQCMFVRIGPVVAAKIKAYYVREALKDYQDLIFACTSDPYAPLVRDAANIFRKEWKETFLDQVIRTNPQLEGRIRWAMNMQPTPPPKDKTTENSS